MRLSTIPLELYIAWRYIKANIKQSFIVMLAVGIGVALIIFIPSVNMSFYDRMLNRAVEKSPHIVVTREMKTRERNTQLLRERYPKAEDVRLSDKTLNRKRNILAYRTVMEQLLDIPGMASAAPFVQENVIAVRGSKVMGGTLQGIVPELEQQISKVADDMEEGSLSDLQGNRVILGWRLADELGVDIGSRIQLVTSQGNRSFKVIGTLNSGLYQKDYGTILTDLNAAQKLLGMSNEVTGIGLKVEDVYNADKTARLIHNMYGFKAESWMEQNKLLLDELQSFRVIIGFIDFMIVFAAASSITSILIMIVSSKSREIGIMKAMGTSQWQIIRLFMIQAIFLSLLGAAFGILGGFGIIELYNATPYARAETAYGFSMEPAQIDPGFTLMAVIYAMISSFLASFIPAWQAGRLNPVEAINK